MSGWAFTYGPEVLAWFNDQPTASEETIAAALRCVPPICLPMLVAMDTEAEAKGRTR